MIRDTLLTRCHVNYTNPLTVLQEAVDSLVAEGVTTYLDSGGDDKVSPVLIPGSRRLFANARSAESSPSFRLLLSIDHPSDWNMVQRCLGDVSLQFCTSVDQALAIDHEDKSTSVVSVVATQQGVSARDIPSDATLHVVDSNQRQLQSYQEEALSRDSRLRLLLLDRGDTASFGTSSSADVTIMALGSCLSTTTMEDLCSRIEQRTAFQ